MAYLKAKFIKTKHLKMEKLTLDQAFVNIFSSYTKSCHRIIKLFYLKIIIYIIFLLTLSAIITFN
jgi:hypothetical protein